MRGSLILGATILGAHMMAGVAQAQISDDVVKIGVLTDLSGPASTPKWRSMISARPCSASRSS
jgi:branched-chain amino acid transport system substrate-binding protein